jgi:hypothetical protein
MVIVTTSSAKFLTILEVFGAPFHFVLKGFSCFLSGKSLNSMEDSIGKSIENHLPSGNLT